MSIVRIGLAETKNFAEGWEAIFGKQKTEAKEATPSKPAAKAKPAKKKTKKK